MRFPVILTHCTWIHTVAAWTTYGCSLDHIRLQVRFPVILTAEEKEIARKIVLAFGQVRGQMHATCMAYVVLQSTHMHARARS